MELVIQLKKFSLEKTKSSSSQVAREMKHVPLFWEVQVNIFWTKLKDHFTMPFVSLFKPWRTNKLFMEEVMLKSKWPWLVKNLPLVWKVKKPLPFNHMPELWDNFPSPSQKMQDLTLTNWFMTSRSSCEQSQIQVSTSKPVSSIPCNLSQSQYLYINEVMPSFKITSFNFR